MEGRIAIKLIQENGGKRMKGGRGLKGAAERSLSLRAVELGSSEKDLERRVCGGGQGGGGEVRSRIVHEKQKMEGSGKCGGGGSGGVGGVKTMSAAAGCEDVQKKTQESENCFWFP